MAAGGVSTLAGCATLDSDAPEPEPSGRTTTADDAGDRRTVTRRNADVYVVTDYSGEEWIDEWEEAIVPGFRDEYGATAFVEYAMGETRERLEADVRTGDDPPELAHGTLSEHADFVLRGETVPVGDLVADLETANGDLLHPASIRTGGETHLVPHGLSMGTFNYRADVYERLGLSVPRTWNELRENARAIDRAEEVDARGFAIPLSPGGSTVFPRNGAEAAFTGLLYNAGGDYWRWANSPGGDVAVEFEPRHVRPALDLLSDLARYSPTPSGMDRTDLIRQWSEGRVAQCFYANAWLCGLAHRLDATRVALDTRQAPVPTLDRSLDPTTRGWLRTDGTPIFRAADDPDLAREFLRYAYEGRDRQAARSVVEPMRWLPPYAGVMGTDRYRNAEVFQVEDGYFLERNRYCREEILPRVVGNRPRTTAARVARQGPAVADMLTGVLSQDEPVDDAIGRARTGLREQLRAARDLAG